MTLHPWSWQCDRRGCPSLGCKAFLKCTNNPQPRRQCRTHPAAGSSFSPVAPGLEGGEGGPADGRGWSQSAPQEGGSGLRPRGARWPPICRVSLDVALLLLQVDGPLVSGILGRRWLSLHP